MSPSVKILILLVLLAVGVWLVRRVFGSFIESVVVWEFEKGLRFDNGRFTGLVEPGKYRIWRHKSRIDRIDTRITHSVIAGQEVLSADSVALKVSLIAKYRVTDAVVAVTLCQDFSQSLYSILQIGLREIIGASPIDELLANRASVDAELLSRCEKEVADLGLTLLAVNVRDIMFPGELKKIFAQVVEARKQGQASLERARGETAALRNLANAAKLLENNPNLMQLRLLQTVGESSGNSLVLGLSARDGVIPIVSAPSDSNKAE